MIYVIEIIGAGGEDRTPDLRFTKPLGGGFQPHGTAKKPKRPLGTRLRPYAIAPRIARPERVVR